jgi:hypothetical protein
VRMLTLAVAIVVVVVLGALEATIAAIVTPGGRQSDDNAITRQVDRTTV